MEVNAHYILENLKLQASLQSRLLGLMRKKRTVMAQREVGALESVLSEEQGVVEKIKHLAELRNLMIERFAGGFGLSVETVELKSIGDSLQGQFRSAFELTLRELSETARQIVELNTLGVRVIAPPAGNLGGLMESLLSGSENPFSTPQFGEKSQLTFPFPGDAMNAQFDPMNGMLLVLPHGALGGPLREFAASDDEAEQAF